MLSLLSSIFGAPDYPNKIQRLTMKAGIAAANAAKSGGRASPTASATIQCIVAAAKPLTHIFDDNSRVTLQEKLLFTLVLAGSCSTLTDEGELGEGLEIEISPRNISSALDTYKKIMDRDLTYTLCPALQHFVAQARAPATN